MINLTYPDKFAPIVMQEARIKVCKGGRGSAKSHSFGKHSVARAVRERIKIACVREIQSSIKDSVHAVICEKINELNLNKYFNITDKSITSWMGSEFIFKGLHRNVQEIKSLEGVDVAWLEEGEGASQESLDILIPTLFRKKNCELWVSFNPETEKSACNMTFVKNKRPDSLVIEMNWKDNPWFPEGLRKEKDWCKETDYEKYLWIWEGHYKEYAEDLIFKGKIEVDCDFTGPDDVQRFQGMDFGFSNDPSSLHQMYIHDNCLWIEFEAYGRGVEIEELPGFMRTIPGVDKWGITADSARPDTISYLTNQGFNINGAEKGQGSVEDGIQFLRSFKKIFIHRRCTGAKEDFENYRYKRDRVTNLILPIPLDKSNHACDGCRYALESYIRGNVSIYDVM